MIVSQIMREIYISHVNLIVPKKPNGMFAAVGEHMPSASMKESGLFDGDPKHHHLPRHHHYPDRRLADRRGAEHQEAAGVLLYLGGDECGLDVRRLSSGRARPGGPVLYLFSPVGLGTL